MSQATLTRAVQPMENDADLSDLEFTLLRDLVQEHTGICLGRHKREMLRARLRKRLRAVGVSRFRDYYQYLLNQGPASVERTLFINAVTTNVTDFFREGHHFDYLRNHWLPEVRARAWRDGRRLLRVWSAGCSTGEEPYSIAMTIRDVLGAAAGSWDVRILASDIDSDALQSASAGVYRREKVARLPEALLTRHFLRGVGSETEHVRIRPEVQEWVAFRRISLTDDPWPIRTSFDAIFCRNVLIYFDRPTQRRILERFLGYLRPDGLLFLGHSEGLHGLSAGLTHRGQTIFQRTDGDT